jgi:hypothetical protein
MLAFWVLCFLERHTTDKFWYCARYLYCIDQEDRAVTTVDEADKWGAWRGFLCFVLQGGYFKAQF